MNDSVASRHQTQVPIIIGLGSNLPTKESTPTLLIGAVVNSLMKHRVVIDKVSQPWASRAWPDSADPMFVNAVLLAFVTVEPQIILQYLQDVETIFGRTRLFENAPRSLDLDLIAYGDEIIMSDALSVPHPRAHERAFVMGPLCDIFPQWVHPQLKMTAQDLYARATIGCDAYPLTEDVWPTL